MTVQVEPDVALASLRDLEPAVQVWQAANAARGRVPTAKRIARVQRKVRAADAVLVVAYGNGTVVAMAYGNGTVVAMAYGNGTVVAMALAEPGPEPEPEPGREDDGGENVPGYGHISMVFVVPSPVGPRDRLDVAVRAAPARPGSRLDVLDGMVGLIELNPRSHWRGGPRRS